MQRPLFLVTWSALCAAGGFWLAELLRQPSPALPTAPAVHYSPEARAALESGVEIAPMTRRISFTSDECPNCEAMREQTKALAEKLRKAVAAEGLPREEAFIRWMDACSDSPESHRADVTWGLSVFVADETAEADLAALRALSPLAVLSVMQQGRAWWRERHASLSRIPPGDARPDAEQKARAEANARRQELALEFTRLGLPQPLLERFLDL